GEEQSRAERGEERRGEERSGERRGMEERGEGREKRGEEQRGGALSQTLSSRHQLPNEYVGQIFTKRAQRPMQLPEVHTIMHICTDGSVFCPTVPWCSVLKEL